MTEPHTDMTIHRWSSNPSRRTIHPRDAHSLVGTEVFATDWRKVDAEHLDRFHWSVDEVESAADMAANALFPRAEENVDGFMLLSLATSAFFNNYPIGAEGLVAWNYGVDSVRFPTTVYLEDDIRLRVTLRSVDDRPQGWLLRNAVTMDMRGSDRPAMVGEFLVMMTEAD